LPEEGPIIWMRPEKPARGPAPMYSRDQIADAAIKIADTEGMEAVSMRKVAAVLGTGAMSLYRYVPTKEDLVSIMVDKALGELPLLPATGDWRADLGALAWRMRSFQLRHPWFSGSSAGRPALGPNMMARLENHMSLVDGLGLDVDGMSEVTGLIMTWVAGFVQGELAEREAQRRTGMTERQWQLTMGPYMMRLVESGEHPYLARFIFEAGQRDTGAQFARSLKRILDGIEAGLPPKQP
jgi:AcrR family transcriptional regulator